MPAKVVDASVIASIIFQEPEADAALELLADTEIVAPTLLAFELTSIARNKARRHPEQRQAIARALIEGLALEIRWIDVDHSDVLRLALELGLTTYDASYLQVARSHGITLVTFDQQLRAAAGSTG